MKASAALPQTWTLDDMARGVDPRTAPSALPAAEIYEAAIQRAEATFRPNKTRAWVLKILREYIAEATHGAFCPGCGFRHTRGTGCEADALDDDGVRPPSPAFDPFSVLDA